MVVALIVKYITEHCDTLIANLSDVQQNRRTAVG
jgi:hypothetical protein